MSLLYYKLKNAIEQQSVTFDGSVIQIGDVKRLVAEKQGLGPDGYQEITLYDPNTGTEYDDDGKVVPRNTLVEVKRTPAATFAPLGSAAAGGVVEKKQEEQGGTMGEDESQALQNLMQGTASTWQKEVRQGVARGRGRGKGTVPAEYRCPRCEAYGAHWIQDCPTHGDPTYDRKRVRPPVGIPMTRLARSMEGGLVLPDGNTGTLVANEEAFAKEVLGIGAMHQPAVAGEETLALEGPEQQQVEEDVGAAEKPASAPVAFAGLPFSISAMAEPPKLAGMSLKLDLNGTTDSVQKKDDAFFDLLKNPELPRGPKNFLLKAYDRDSPLSRREFEREQRHYRKDRDDASRSPSRHRRERRERSPSRRRSRSSSRRRSHRDLSSRRRERRRSHSPRDGGKRSPRKRTREDMDVSKPEDSTIDTRKVSDEQQQTKSDEKMTDVDKKHSPIRWVPSAPARGGMAPAGQDEEPEIDYGASEDEADDAQEFHQKKEEESKQSRRGHADERKESKPASKRRDRQPRESDRDRKSDRRNNNDRSRRSRKR